MIQQPERYSVIFLSAVESIEHRKMIVEQQINELVDDQPWSETVHRLRCFRGISTLTAMGLYAEIGDFNRFESPAQLASYVGLVPSEYSSGALRRQGRITKTGSKHARWLLIEAAHHYRHRPAVSYQLKRRQNNQPPAITGIAWRCQHRLHNQFNKLRHHKKKPATTTIVACARELTGFVWEAATHT
jgi:transposase